MSPQSRLVADILLIVLPTVELGGASILSLLPLECRPRRRLAGAALSGSLALRG